MMDGCSHGLCRVHVPLTTTHRTTSKYMRTRDYTSFTRTIRMTELATIHWCACPTAATFISIHRSRTNSELPPWEPARLPLLSNRLPWTDSKTRSRIIRGKRHGQWTLNTQYRSRSAVILAQMVKEGRISIQSCFNFQAWVKNQLKYQ